MAEASSPSQRIGFLPRPVPSIEFAGLERPNSRTSQPRPGDRLFLDKNENADPELRDWLTGIMRGLPGDSLSTYPDLGPTYAALADWLGLPADHLVLTTGCDGAIQRTFEVFIGAGDVVLLTRPTFAMYPLYANSAGALSEFLDYMRTEDGPALALATIVETISSLKPRLVCLPNPDSPTGNVLSLYELSQIAETCQSTGTILLVDEAYHPFSAVTAASLAARSPHVLVSRTFSKAWGLAGVRAGYLIGYPETIEWFHRTRPMYEIGGFAGDFLTRVLRDPSQMYASVARLNEGKAIFSDALVAMDYKVLPSGGNFLHVAFASDALEVHKALHDLVLYRPDSHEECLRGYSRFSSTTPELFEPIIQAIRSARLKVSAL